jgi:hypothetical protein
MTATEIVIVIAGSVVGWSLLNLGVMALMIWASNPDPHLGEAADAASREPRSCRQRSKSSPTQRLFGCPGRWLRQKAPASTTCWLELSHGTKSAGIGTWSGRAYSFNSREELLKVNDRRMTFV